MLRAASNAEAGEHNENWLNWFDRVSDSTMPWARIGRPYVLAMSGAEGIGAADLDNLDRLDPDAVLDLVAATQRRQPSYLGRFVDSLLPWLRGRLPSGISSRWKAMLLNLPADQPGQNAWIDFLLLCSGEVPVRNLWQADKSYRDAVVRAAMETDLSRVQREQFVATVATSLRSGWSDDGARWREVLDTFWQLTHPPGQQELAAHRVTAAIADEVLTRSQLLRAPELERWLTRLELDPRLHRWIVEIRLGQLPPDTEPATVAGLFAELYVDGVPHKRIVTELRSSG
jgi:hypothetical protein